MKDLFEKMDLEMDERLKSAECRAWHKLMVDLLVNERNNKAWKKTLNIDYIKYKNSIGR